MTYETISSRIEEQDENELTAVITLRREDGVQADVWACAGIPESSRGEVATVTHNGTWGTSRGYESSWVPGDSVDGWCPQEFADDDLAVVAAIAETAALKLWREAS